MACYKQDRWSHRKDIPRNNLCLQNLWDRPLLLVRAQCSIFLRLQKECLQLLDYQCSRKNRILQLVGRFPLCCMCWMFFRRRRRLFFQQFFRLDLLVKTLLHRHAWIICSWFCQKRSQLHCLKVLHSAGRFCITWQENQAIA